MKVLNYGSLNVDYVYSVDHIIVGGETQHSSKLEVFSGGKGLNQSIALAKAGVPVCCFGRSPFSLSRVWHRQERAFSLPVVAGLPAEWSGCFRSTGFPVRAYK